MITRFSYRHFLIVWLALALAQFACSFGAPAATAIPQLPPTSSPEASPVPPTNSPQPSLEPPTSGPQATQTSPAPASDRGTPQEAKAMLQKAVEHYNAVGRTQALADFTGRVPPFFDRDLYVACIDSNLKQSANGGFPYLVGSSVEPLSRAVWDAATTTTIGSVNYQWINPASGKTEPKTFFYEKVGTDVCGVGAYSP